MLNNRRPYAPVQQQPPLPPSSKDELRRMREENGVYGPHVYRTSGTYLCYVMAAATAALVISLAGAVIASITMAGVYDGSEGWDAAARARGYQGAYFGDAIEADPHDQRPDSWNSWGRDARGSRHTADRHAPSAATAGRIALAWSRDTRGTVRTQPSVHDGVAYYCDTAGYLSAVSAHTGALVWEARVAALTGGPAGVDQCRGPPAVDPASGLLVTGSRNTSTVFAVRLSDGKLAWKLVADAHARSVITQPPFVADGVVYAGVSSTEELDAADSAYPCCSFRGSVLAIGAASGELLWKRYTMPQGYVGGAVYGGPVVMDLRRRQIYVATGNLYLSPAGLTDCKQRVAALGTYFDDDPCLPSVVYANSLLALDVDTGAVIWARRFSPATAWNAACGVTTPVWASPARPYNCPSTQALNADFAQGPMLVSVGERDVLVIGQKSGVMWTVNPNTGAVVESAALGPAGDGGGMLWSGANDGTSAYMAVSNSASTAFQLAGAPVPSNNASAPYDTVTTGSALTAVDVATSRIRWQYPVEAWFYSNLPVTSVNDLVLSASVVRPAYATRIGTLPGSLKAHLASTGRVVWRLPAAYTATSGVTAAAGRLLLGVTYQPLASVAGTPRLVAFGVQ